MSKLVLNTHLFIIIPVTLIIGFSGCSSVTSERKLPVIGDINLPFVSEGKKVPAIVINRQERFKKLPVPPSGFITVQKGDTIYSIVNRYDVTPYKLISENNLKAPFDLVEGQVLKIISRNTHTVRLGDSLFSISKQYSVNQFEIAQLNAIKEPYELQVGQVLQLPDVKDFSVFEMTSPSEEILAIEIQRDSVPAIEDEQVIIEKNTERKFFVAPKLAAGDSFNWPLSGQIINPFGLAERGVHNDGVDIAASFGSDIQTTAPGTVAYIGTGLKSFGTLILVKHDGGIISAYAHLSEVLVNEGDVLSSGQIIGRVGQTGRVGSPTLHFEIRQNRTPIDPASVIKS